MENTNINGFQHKHYMHGIGYYSKEGDGLMYVSEVIGNSFEKWKERDIILINGPTGCGKSTFILHDLLKFAIGKRDKEQKEKIIPKPILYLVNRQVLQRQLEEELKRNENELLCSLNRSNETIRNFITITTYQSIEKGLRAGNYDKTIAWMKKYQYVVYDECHYFYNDSDFNTSTELSYDCLRTFFNTKIQIFMSATMKNMRNMIYLRRSSKLCVDAIGDIANKRFKEYNIPLNYDYIKLKVFNDLMELKEIICNQSDGKEKWLIFIDSIEDGKEMKTRLQENVDSMEGISAEDIGFVDARFGSDEETAEIVEDIVENDSTKKKILISTAVLDNGISFKDFDLRNIVILADTEESFIQMLGRKRPDQREVVLYICRRDIDHFNKRIQYIEKQFDFYREFNDDYKRMFHATEDNEQYYPFAMFITQDIPDSMGQSRLLDRIISDSESYRIAKKMYYQISGLLAINSFAIEKFRTVQLSYQHMVRELVEDENAFVRQQADWLGLALEDVNLSIQESDDELDLIHREMLKKQMVSYLNRILSQQENQEMKGEIKNDIIYFLKRAKKRASDETQKKEIKKIIVEYGKRNKKGMKKRVISAEKFNISMEFAGLDYVMTKPSGSEFLIQHKPEEKIISEEQ